MFIKLSLQPSLGILLHILFFLCFGVVVPFFFFFLRIGNDLLCDEITIFSKNSPKFRCCSNLDLEPKLHLLLDLQMLCNFKKKMLAFTVCV